MAEFNTLTAFVISTIAVFTQAEDLARGWGDDIEWNSFEKGLSLAKEQQKPLMLVIHKSWCGACKALKPKFAESEEIRDLSKNFVMVNTQDDEEPSGEIYKPDGGYIPRILFLDPSGSVVTDLYNKKGNSQYKYYYFNAEGVVESMKTALSSFGSSGRKEQADEL